jgi:hypothetical protein
MATLASEQGRERNLSRGEIALAAQVFWTTLPYRDIFLAPYLGIGEREYTLNYSGGGGRPPHYKIFVGLTGFRGMDLTYHGRHTLIHELMHVWQSRNSNVPTWVILNSGACQVREWLQGDPYGTACYAVQPGEPWDSYNAEQQATLIEQWYLAGMPDHGVLYPYVRDVIRKGRPALPG